jgi:hypothetical protein
MQGSRKRKLREDAYVQSPCRLRLNAFLGWFDPGGMTMFHIPGSKHAGCIDVVGYFSKLILVANVNKAGVQSGRIAR